VLSSCLSDLCSCLGNYYGLGSVRRQELYKSALNLGLFTHQVHLHSDKRLPDDPAIEWDLDVISSVVSRVVSQLSIDTVKALVLLTQ